MIYREVIELIENSATAEKITHHIDSHFYKYDHIPDVAMSPTISFTYTVTESETPTPTPTMTYSPTMSCTPTTSETPTDTVTPTVSDTPTVSQTATTSKDAGDIMDDLIHANDGIISFAHGGDYIGVRFNHKSFVKQYFTFREYGGTTYFKRNDVVYENAFREIEIKFSNVWFKGYEVEDPETSELSYELLRSNPLETEHSFSEFEKGLIPSDESASKDLYTKMYTKVFGHDSHLRLKPMNDETADSNNHIKCDTIIISMSIDIDEYETQIYKEDNFAVDAQMFAKYFMIKPGNENIPDEIKVENIMIRPTDQFGIKVQGGIQHNVNDNYLSSFQTPSPTVTLTTSCTPTISQTSTSTITETVTPTNSCTQTMTYTPTITYSETKTPDPMQDMIPQIELKNNELILVLPQKIECDSIAIEYDITPDDNHTINKYTDIEDIMVSGNDTRYVILSTTESRLPFDKIFTGSDPAYTLKFMEGSVAFESKTINIAIHAADDQTYEYETQVQIFYSA